MGLKKICENLVVSMFSHGVDSAFMIGGVGMVLYGGIKLYQVASEMNEAKKREVDDTGSVKYAKPKAMKIEISGEDDGEEDDNVEIDISDDVVSKDELTTETTENWSKKIQKYVKKMLQGVIMIQTSNLISLGFTKVLGDRFNEQYDVISKITTMLNRFRGRSSLLNTLSTVADERSRGFLLGESKGIDSVINNISRIMTKG